MNTGDTNKLTITTSTSLLTKYIPFYKRFAEDITLEPQTIIHDYIVTSAHPITGAIDADLFKKAFEQILEDHEISSKCLDDLLYLSLYIKEEYLKLKTQQIHSEALLERARSIIALLKMPFNRRLIPEQSIELDLTDSDGNLYQNIEVDYKVVKGLSEKQLRTISSDKHVLIKGFTESPLEFSKDVTISISSGNGSVVNLESGFTKQILNSIALLLLEDQQRNKTKFFDKLNKWSGDVTDLKDEFVEDSDSTFTSNKLLCNIISIMISYLEDNNLLTRGRAAKISHKQSAFLFDYFALLQVLDKKPDFEETFNHIELTRKASNNYYLTIKRTYQKNYSNPTTHLYIIYNRNLL